MCAAGAQASVVGSLLSIFLCFFMKTPGSVDTVKKYDKEAKDSNSIESPEVTATTTNKKFPLNVIAVIKAVWLLLGTKLVSGVVTSAII